MGSGSSVSTLTEIVKLWIQVSIPVPDMARDTRAVATAQRKRVRLERDEDNEPSGADEDNDVKHEKVEEQI